MFLRWQVENQEDGKSLSLPTWSNLAIFPGGENDPEILLQKNSSSADWFSERFGGIPCPPKGRVFTEFSNQIHTGCSGAFELDINSVCYIWIDPGYAHAYAVLVAQKRGDDIYITDEVYENGLVSSDIITICKKQPWWNRVAGGTIDIAAKQHQGMPAVEEIWWKEAGIRLRSNKIRIEDGIERLKTFLKVNPVTGRPSVYINTRCKGLISELGGCPSPITNQEAVYRWKMDKSGIVVGSVPEDKNCDAIKALIYGLIDTCGYSLAQQGKRNIIPVKFF